MADTLTTKDLVARRISSRKPDIAGMLFEGALLIMLLASLVILVTLLADVVTGAINLFRHRSPWDFVTSGLSLNPESAGVSSAIIGSVSLTVVVAIVSFPLGVGAAVYLEEYAPANRLTRFVTTNIRNLAGVPSIVYGLLGLAVVVKVVNGLGLGGEVAGRNLLAGGLTLAILVLPIVIITASEAIRAVPNTIREAGLGVGATQWEVIRHHILPSALPGILTGTVLSLARAFGETAPLLVVGAVTGFFSAAEGASLFEQATNQYTALPVVVLSWSKQPQDVFRNELAPAAIFVLLVVLLTANAAAILLRNKYETKW